MAWGLLACAEAVFASFFRSAFSTGSAKACRQLSAQRLVAILRNMQACLMYTCLVRSCPVSTALLLKFSKFSKIDCLLERGGLTVPCIH